MTEPTITARARALLAAWRAEMHRSYVVHGATPVTYNDPDIARDIAELDEVIAGLAVEAQEQLHGLDTDEHVRFYEHDFYVLSNFSSFNLQWGGYTYPTSEHAYHVAKFRDHSDIARLIALAPSAHQAFKIAERHKADRSPEWDEIKVDVMRAILRAKAAQHEYVHRKLLATGDRTLIEDSWRDDFWGWGPNRDGKNMLGRLWMEIRAELRAQGIEES